MSSSSLCTTPSPCSTLITTRGIIPHLPLHDDVVIFLLALCRTVTVGQCWSSRAVITRLYSWTRSSTVWLPRAVRLLQSSDAARSDAKASVDSRCHSAGHLLDGCGDLSRTGGSRQVHDLRSSCRRVGHSLTDGSLISGDGRGQEYGRPCVLAEQRFE